MNDPDYNEYMIVWRKDIDFESSEEECCDKLRDDEKVGLVVEVDTDQIIDSLMINHSLEYIVQFVKDLSMIMESTAFDVAMFEYFKSCVIEITKDVSDKIAGGLREW